ncbi:MAG: putative bifunctional diguanylate cyclase/phosphodiesterase [Gammaproteobacteria bacterium]
MRTSEDTLINAILEEVPVFTNLTPSQRKDMQSLLKIESHPAGTVIIKEGERGARVFVILEGNADVIQHDDSTVPPSEHVLASLGKHDTIGDLALIDDQPRSADVRATTPIKLASFDLSELKNISSKEIPLEAALRLNCAMKVANYLRGSNLKTLSDRKKHRTEIALLTNYDIVTGLPNQHFFAEKLKECIEKSPGQSHVICQVELVEFKEIADAMGTDFADEFLNEFSERLDSVVPENTLIARVGQNQFMLLLSHVKDIDALSHLAKKILNLMVSAVYVRNEEVFVNGYVGISHYPDDGKTAAVLMKNAGLALDAAKLYEPNSFAFYDAKLNSAVEERRILIKDFRTAVEEDQFEIYYQPQLSLTNGGLVGAEALIRWPHPTKGMIPPGVFIPIIEQSGLIIALGNWILRTACAQVHMWKNADLPILPRIAINLSSLQFRQKDFVGMIKGIIDQSRIDPSMIELEITESVMMKDMDETIARVNELADMGFMIAIDDFGTGYSSLSYLRKLPIHKLKVDQSFVRDLFTSNEAQDIVRCIISLAKSLKLITIAEGIETVEQLEFLKQAGCDEGQGYLFSHAVSTSQFEKDFLLNKGK